MHRVVIALIVISSGLMVAVNIYYQRPLDLLLNYLFLSALAAFVGWVLMRELEPVSNLPALLIIPMIALLPPEMWSGLITILIIMATMRAVTGITGYPARRQEYLLVIAGWIVAIALIALSDNMIGLMDLNTLDPLVVLGLTGSLAGTLFGLRDTVECDANKLIVSAKKLTISRVFFCWCVIIMALFQIPGAGIMLIAGLIFGIHKVFDLFNNFILEG